MMVPFSPLILLLCLGLAAFQVQAFAPGRSVVVSTTVGSVNTTRRRRDGNAGTTTALFSSPVGDRPPPRRTLKKRKNKRRQRMDKLSQNVRGISIKDDMHTNNNSLGGDEDDVEIRPVRRRDAVEAGLDYWIDDGDLEREKQRKISVKNRKSMEGTISQERLREEVVAPYKQNWIGMFSVFIVILSAIATKFPELLQTPLIPIPDL